MKIEELSVGNLVSYRGEIYSIFSITNSEIIRLYDYIFGIFSCHVDELDPIKLTEELLINNGFIHDTDSEVAYHDESIFLNGFNNQISFHNSQDYINSDNLWHVHIDNVDYNSICNCELSYVHEFQNLCSLLKLEFKLNII